MLQFDSLEVYKTVVIRTRENGELETQQCL